MQLPVYFISDIHLMLNVDDTETHRREKLFRFFKEISAQKGSLFIVGDLFDFYFEYKNVIPKVFFDFYHELYQLKNNGTSIYYMAGNHDYWVGDFMKYTLTDQLFPDDVSLQIGEKKFYITHGDGILSWDRGYRLLKTVIRHKLFIWLFRWIHPRIGYAIANIVSKKGHHYDHTEDYNKRVLDELIVFADTLIEDDHDFIITGHYHQSKVVEVGNGKLVVLGDWLKYFSYGFFDGKNFELKYFE